MLNNHLEHREVTFSFHFMKSKLSNVSLTFHLCCNKRQSVDLNTPNYGWLQSIWFRKSFLHHLQAKVRHRVADWMLSWPWGGDSSFQRWCRSTKHLHCDPGTLLIWNTEDLRQEFGCCCTTMYKHLWKNSMPKIFHFVQIHIFSSSALC